MSTSESVQERHQEDWKKGLNILDLDSKYHGLFEVSKFRDIRDHVPLHDMPVGKKEIHIYCTLADYVRDNEYGKIKFSLALVNGEQMTEYQIRKALSYLRRMYTGIYDTMNACIADTDEEFLVKLGADKEAQHRCFTEWKCIKYTTRSWLYHDLGHEEYMEIYSSSEKGRDLKRVYILKFDEFDLTTGWPMPTIDEEATKTEDEKIWRRKTAIPQSAVGEAFTGEDELGVREDAKALAQIITFKDLTPPFVLGILGGWGSGKTTTMKLIEKAIIDIQKDYKTSNRDQYKYCGHLYLCRFRAWEYAKGNIWASLMHKLMLDLNQQLILEEILRKCAKQQKGDQTEYGSLIEEWDALSKTDIDFAEKYSDYVTQPLDFNTASPALASAINIGYEKQKKELDEKKKEISQAEKKVEVLKTFDAIDVQFGKKMTSAILDCYKVWKKKKTEADIAPVQNHTTSADEETALISSRIVDDAQKLRVEIEQSLKQWKIIKRILGRVLSDWKILLVITVSITISILLVHFKAQLEYLFGNVLLCVPVILDYIKKFKEMVTPVVDLLQNLEEKVADIDEADLQHADRFIAKQIQEHNEKISTWKREYEDTRERILVLEGESIQEICSEAKMTAYEGNLNIVHKAQKDLISIASSLSNNKKSEDLFPRGEPRIVLMIDDLDRCPQDKVVDTLEALQLLVSSEAFVVILAIDMQYVTLSLENRSEGILKREKHPSGLDYLEKIIQLAYRVSPIASKESVTSYISSLTGNITSGVTDDDSGEILQSKANSGVKSDNNKAPHALNRHSLSGNVEQIDTSQKELGLLAEVLSKINISPRAIKRIINSFKVMKVILHRDGALTRDEYEINQLMKCCLIILGLSACLDPRVRSKMCDAYSNLELKHMNMGYNQNSENNNVYKVLFGNEYMDESFNAYESLLETLKQFEWHDEEKWSEVKKFLRLVRCFSFVGESSTDDRSKESENHHPTGLIDSMINTPSNEAES